MAEIESAGEQSYWCRLGDVSVNTGRLSVVQEHYDHLLAFSNPDFSWLW